MRSLRGKVAVVGVGESTYYKRGEASDSEFVLTLKAILAACADAGISAKDVDGFASYSNDRNEPSRLAAALGCRELTFSNMQWGGGGGGAAAAVANGAAAIAAGLADCVVAFRGLAQGQRFAVAVARCRPLAEPGADCRQVAQRLRNARVFGRQHLAPQSRRLLECATRADVVRAAKTHRTQVVKALRGFPGLLR